MLEVHLMFLVHDDQSQSLKGQEDRGSYSDDNVVGSIRELLQPYVGTLYLGKLAVIDTQTLAEDSLQTVSQLAGEHNLGQ